ncbi:MAG: MFS transporter [Methylobacter sp.]|uniref:MFS transporter n=1 Tax=Methylobacter sp. TaxID=2051955 RepID=UPI002589EF2F|nr:MFS transporter [Methylobacter sp.]MCL7422953.1 MFS transporter [Methylobacter sp.]
MSQSLSGFGALRHRNFTLYLSARLLATIAVQMQTVAVGWQIYALSGDVMDLGLVGLSQFAPFAVLILIAGQAADQWDRRWIITLCFVVEMLCGVLLLGFSLSGLEAVWPVFAVMALYGSARAFMMPASQAIVINLVPAERFGNAVALSSSTYHVAVILGPTLGGLLYLAGPQTVYAIVAGLLGLSALLVLLIRTDRKAAAGREPMSWHTLLEGLRFVRAKPIVLGAISLDLFAVLFGGAVALLPVYARDILHIGPHGLGLLRTAPAVGAALTAVVLAWWPISRRVGRWMFGGVALFGAATVVFGLSHNFYLSLLALFLIGAGDMVSVYIRHMLVQLETPDAIRGRVSAVNSVFIGASNELGEFESGLTAAWFGLVPAVVIGGGATLAITLLWIWLFPPLRRIDRFPHAQR